MGGQIHHQNHRISNYVAYLILVRSMWRCSGSISVDPGEERVLNFIAVQIFANFDTRIDELIKNLPEMNPRSIKLALKGLYLKNLIKFDLKGLATKVNLTEDGNQLLSNMGSCVYHASPDLVDVDS